MNTNLVIFQYFRKYTCKVLHVHVSIDNYPFFIYRDSDFMNTSRCVVLPDDNAIVG